MKSRLLFTLVMNLATASVTFGQNWTVHPNVDPRLSTNWTSGNGVYYPTNTYSPAHPQVSTVWRETFNGHSARPVTSVTYQTAAHGGPAYGTTHQVYYAPAVNTPNACASPMLVNYASAPPSVAPYVHYNSLPPVAGVAPNYHYKVGPNGKYYVGYGLFGQPRAFGRNQPVLNFLRFMLP